MAYCTNCGAQVDDNAKFCGACGNKMASNPQPSKSTARKTTYDGAIHKCPNCGTGLASFVKNCPECGYELRGADGAESVSDFARRYASTTSNEKKVDLIRTFVIPNTKEDILEFAILLLPTLIHLPIHVILLLSLAVFLSRKFLRHGWRNLSRHIKKRLFCFLILPNQRKSKNYTRIKSQN